jgi:hypothetical protein
MTTATLPPIDVLKQHAKRLRAALAEDGDFISHSEALELIAKQNGCRDWNTLYAAAGNGPPRFDPQIGARVAGAYLGQSFCGVFIAVEALNDDRRRVTIDLDEPVDVVTFDSFSAFRRRITCVIDASGVSPSRTSNGKPHLEVRR